MTRQGFTVTSKPLSLQSFLDKLSHERTLSKIILVHLDAFIASTMYAYDKGIPPNRGTPNVDVIVLADMNDLRLHFSGT